MGALAPGRAAARGRAATSRATTARFGSAVGWIAFAGAVPAVARRTQGELAMIMADVLMWFFIVAGAYLAFVSYWLACAALFPSVVEECARRYSPPLAPAGLGLVVLLPLVVIGVVAAKNAPHAAAGALLKGALLSLLLPALLGSAGLAPPLGTGLFRHGAPLLRPRLPRRGRP